MTKTDDKPETSKRTPVTREELYTQFNQAIETVKLYTNQIENEIARPAVRMFSETFEERPILAIFLASLSVLSFFPTFAFLASSVVTTLSLVTFALVISFGVVLAFMFILISTLVASVFIAAVITAICFDVYLAFRLLTLVGQLGASEGFSCWFGELWKHLVGIGSSPFHFTRQANLAVIQHRQPNESTEDSDLDTKVEDVPLLDLRPTAPPPQRPVTARHTATISVILNANSSLGKNSMPVEQTVISYTQHRRSHRLPIMGVNVISIIHRVLL